MQLSERQMKMLIEFLKHSVGISELDISWNQMSGLQLGEFFKAIEENKTITHLNMGQIKMSNEEVIKPNFGRFCNFIKFNTRLTHLNLSSVDLPDSLMMELLNFIKRSMSLHVVHLCGNTISEGSLAVISAKLKPVKIGGMKEMSKTKLQLIERINETVRPYFMEKYQKIYDSVKVKEMQIEWMSVQKPYEKEAVPITRNENKKLETGYNTTDPALKSNGFTDYFRPLILTKLLGHPEITNSKHWKISNECWMCDKWRYTMIFWNTSLGREFQIQDVQLEEMFDRMVKNVNPRFRKFIKDE